MVVCKATYKGMNLNLKNGIFEVRDAVFSNLYLKPSTMKARPVRCYQDTPKVKKTF